MEDDLKKNENGRQPQKKNENGTQPQTNELEGEPINQNGCDTIVNSPSCFLLLLSMNYN